MHACMHACMVTRDGQLVPSSFLFGVTLVESNPGGMGPKREATPQPLNPSFSTSASPEVAMCDDMVSGGAVSTEN